MTTKTVNGALSTAPLSNNINRYPVSVWRTFLYLAALGILGVIFHASLRVPLHLPGHHGLEWMALLSLARITVPRRWAATATGVAATAFAFLPMWGWHDPFAPLSFVVAAVLYDMLCVILPTRRWQSALIPVAAGLAFAMAGLISLFVGPHGFAASATWSQWSLFHFGFGLTGSLVVLQTGSWIRSRQAPP